MNSKLFLRFHRAAEAAGYPVLLIVSVVALALVVAPIALLGLTASSWAFALAIVSLPAALAVVVAAIHTAISDGDDRSTVRRRIGRPASTIARSRPTAEPPAT